MALKQRGFTLIEILIATLILAIIGVIVVKGLQSAITTKDNLNKVSQRLDQLQIGLTILNKDFQQLVNRPVTDTKGHKEPSLLFKNNNDGILKLTRGGYLNPLSQEKRSTLQRVNFILDGHNFIRETWPNLTSKPNAKPYRQLLFTHVNSISWRFLGNDNQFYPIWPTGNTNANKGSVFPKAVELTITLSNWGTVKRLFAIKSYGEVAVEKKPNSTSTTTKPKKKNAQK